MAPCATPEYLMFQHCVIAGKALVGAVSALGLWSGKVGTLWIELLHGEVVHACHCYGPKY